MAGNPEASATMRLSALFLITALLVPILHAEPLALSGPDYAGALQPQVTIVGKGEIHLVFGRKDGSISHSASSDGGRTFGAPVKIGTLPKLALGMHRGPRLAAAGDRLVVSAISHETGNLSAWSSSDGGRTWEEPVVVNSVPKAAEEGLHAMAANGARVAISWLDDRGGKKELRAAISEDGGRHWAPDILIYHSPDGAICPCCAPSLAFSANGELAAMWRNDLGGCRDLYLAISTDGGRSFGTAGKLGNGTWKVNACPMDGGGLTYLPDGSKPVTLWRRETSLYLAKPGEAEQSLGEGKDPAISAGTKGPLLAWQTSAGLIIQAPGQPSRPLDPAGRGVALASAPDHRAAAAVWESGAPAGGLKIEILGGL